MLTLLLAVLAATTPRSDSVPSALRIAVDSSHHDVLLTYTVPSGSGHDMADMEGMEGMQHVHHGHHVERLLRFTWPVDGWVRGARVEYRDAHGNMAGDVRVHHLTLLNFDRAQLVHGGIERVWAAGEETSPVMLPATVGVPLSGGSHMGLVVAYMPMSMPAGTVITVRLRWTPRNTVPEPVSIIPVPLDVSGHIGASPAYDLPPGRSERAITFRMPLTGRMLGAGGHLHDYAVELRLQDVASGDVLVRLVPRLDSLGHVLSVPQKLFGISGGGRRLVRGREYRVVAVYDNPTGDTLVDGAMGEMGVAFMPDHLRDWPPLRPSDPGLIADLKRLDELGRS